MSLSGKDGKHPKSASSWGIANTKPVCDRVVATPGPSARYQAAMGRQRSGHWVGGVGKPEFLQEVQPWRESGAGAGVWTPPAPPAVVGPRGWCAEDPGPPRSSPG